MKHVRSSSLSGVPSGPASACTYIRRRLYIRMSKLMLRYAPRASPSFSPHTAISRDCSFNRRWFAVPTSISRMMPGGVTYGTGSRLPFSSMFTALMANEVEDGSSGSTSCGPANDSRYRRHSPRINSRRAKRNVTGSDHPFMNMRMNRIDRKSVMPPTRLSNSRTGILNWYQRMVRSWSSAVVTTCSNVSVM